MRVSGETIYQSLYVQSRGALRRDPSTACGPGERYAALAVRRNKRRNQSTHAFVGRKTWYGTHSERGALTAAILFTLVETCKLNHVNPREYFKQLVQDLHDELEPQTPLQFKQASAADAA